MQLQRTNHAFYYEKKHNHALLKLSYGSWQGNNLIHQKHRINCTN